jgi:hypothetical protein
MADLDLYEDTRRKACHCGVDLPWTQIDVQPAHGAVVVIHACSCGRSWRLVRTTSWTYQAISPAPYKKPW